MDIAFLLFDGITPLDAVGPFDVLGKVQGTKARLAGVFEGPPAAPVELPRTGLNRP